MTLLGQSQYIRLPKEVQNLRAKPNPGRPNAVFELIDNITCEELVKRNVRPLAVKFSRNALKDVLGGDGKCLSH